MNRRQEYAVETLLDTLIRMEIEAAWLQAQIARQLAALDAAESLGVRMSRTGQHMATPTPVVPLRWGQPRVGCCRFPLAA